MQEIVQGLGHRLSRLAGVRCVDSRRLCMVRSLVQGFRLYVWDFVCKFRIDFGSGYKFNKHPALPPLPPLPLPLPLPLSTGGSGGPEGGGGIGIGATFLRLHT